MSLPHQAINKIYGDYNSSEQAEKYIATCLTSAINVHISWAYYSNQHIDGLAQGRRNSIANVLETRPARNKPSIR